MWMRFHQEIRHFIRFLFLETEQSLQDINERRGIATVAESTKSLIVASAAIVAQLNGILFLLDQPLLALHQAARPIQLDAHTPCQQVHVIKRRRTFAVEEPPCDIETGDGIDSGNTCSRWLLSLSFACTEQALQDLLRYFAFHLA